MKKSIKFRTLAGILAWIIAMGTIPPVVSGAEEIETESTNEIEIYEASEPAEAEFLWDEPEETESEVTEPEETDSEVIEPTEIEPEVTEPEETEPEVIEPTEIEPEVIEPEETDSEVTEPEETEPEVIEPEETEPEVTEPEKTEPEVTEPEETEPEVTEPEETTPEVIEPVLPEEEIFPEEKIFEITVDAQEKMMEFAAAVELFPNEADYILYDEENDAEVLDEEAYYRAYAAFYEENPDIWTTTDTLFTEASDAFAAENHECDFDAWMQDNGFWEAAEKFYQAVPTPETVAEITAQYEVIEEVELEFTAEQEGMMLYAASAVNTKEGQDVETVPNGQGIKFGLFNYDNNINDNPLSANGYFGFRGTHLGTASTYTANATCDADGYHKNTHATVEKLLVDGYPVFDPRTVAIPENIDKSLGYLFGESGGKGVTGYAAQNTLLQYNTQTGYYTYNSMKNACDFDTSEKKFYVRKYKEQTSTTASSYNVSLYDFLPFNSTSETAENGVYKYDSTNTADYWFGMTMEVEFSQPKDGKVNGEEMIFKFSGDDDVWVFIDDVLVLDLGGTHGTVDGTINFSTGEIKQWLSWNGGKEKKSYESADSDYKESTSLRQRFEAAGENLQGETFVNYTKHTLKFFYLERATAVANCSIEFNIPPMPDKSLRVSKDITSSSENDTTEYLKDTLEYTFRVMKADGSEVYIPEGTEFKLTNADGSETTGVVGDNGEFKLKADQSALFENVIQYAEGSGKIEYYVEEILPKDIRGQYGDVEYEVEAGTNTVIEEETGDSTDFLSFKTGTMKADDGNVVLYRNNIDTEKLSTLRITKEVSDGSTALAGKEFKFKVLFGESDDQNKTGLVPDTMYTVTYYDENGDEQTKEVTVDDSGCITLGHGETVEIPGIISGTKYEIFEVLGNDDVAAKTLITYGEKVYDRDGYPYLDENKNPLKTATTDSRDGADDEDHGITGEFPLASIVHVTATNSTYDVEESLDLYVEKIITGNMGDRSKEFNFTFEIVTEEQPVLLMMSSAEDIPAGDIGTDSDQTIEEQLGHGEQYHIVGIKPGTIIRITEIPEGYTPTVTMGGNELEVVATEDGSVYVEVVVMAENDGKTITFTNDKTATIDTAVTLDYLPYIILFSIVGTGVILASVDHRRRRED